VGPRILAFAGLVSSPLLLISLFGACDNASLVGMGGTCYQSIDCQLGLACVPQEGTDASICTNNLMGIVDVPEAGDVAINYDTGPMEMDQVAPMDNYVPMETGPMETGPMETGTMEAGGD